MPQKEGKIIAAKKAEFTPEPEQPLEIKRRLTRVSAINPDGKRETLLTELDGIKNPPDDRCTEAKTMQRSSKMRVTLADGTLKELPTISGEIQDHATHVYGITREAFHEIGNCLAGLSIAELVQTSTDDGMIKARMKLINKTLEHARKEMGKIHKMPKDAGIKDEKTAGELVDALSYATRQVIKDFEKALEIQSRVDDSDPAIREYLDLMNLSTGMGLKVAENHERLLQGKPRQDALTEFNVNRLIADTASIYGANKTMNLGVPVRTGLAPGELPVTADPDKIRQVLVNLLKNAAQSCDKRARIRPDPPKEILITSQDTVGGAVVKVADNGLGIPGENLDKIFEREFSTKGDEGKGLGLHICRKILGRQGATLDAESPGELQGASFTIKFPKNN